MSVGLDFGTSNSAVALPTGEVIPLDPNASNARLLRSVLFFPEDSRETLTGAAAIDEYLQRPAGRFIQSVKSWLPSGTFHSTSIRNRAMRLEELVAILLRRIRASAEAHVGAPITSVVLGRPARFSLEPERDAAADVRLRDAAALAGFTDVRMLIEPIAAALAYEATLSKDELVLVADFGAGTSDLTIMRVGPGRVRPGDRADDVVASGGVPIGGDRFDAEIMRHKLLRFFGAGSTYEVMGKRMAMPMGILGKLTAWHEMSFIKERPTMLLLDQMLHTSSDVPAIEALVDLVEENLGFRLFRAIEAAKIRLSDAPDTRIVFDEARVSIDERITRKEFDDFCRPLLDTLDGAVTDVLTRAQLDESAIDAVFLTGGSSQIPSVRGRFAQRFGESRLRSADAFASVAEGLGRAAKT